MATVLRWTSVVTSVVSTPGARPWTQLLPDEHAQMCPNCHTERAFIGILPQKAKPSSWLDQASCSIVAYSHRGFGVDSRL